MLTQHTALPKGGPVGSLSGQGSIGVSFWRGTYMEHLHS